MFLIDRLMLLAALLLILGILSSKFSARMGLPVLVLFLGLGMLAGSEGLGGIEFDNFELAHGIATITLGVILFDGGLQTSARAVAMVWKPALTLATAGVLGTAIVTGVGAAYLLGLPLIQGVLLGSIVGSTDAAAVFSLLRSAGVRLKRRLAATLEIESGSNDPMAIFLTVGILEVISGQMDLGIGLVGFFLSQMGIGTAVGLGVGWLSVRLINAINLEAAGLYPVLTGACGMLAFGAAANVGGSGFLAVYIAGVVLGNSRITFKRGTFLFHDGLAWAGQITMFVVLGLLSTPSRLIDVWWEGLVIAFVLTFIARPLMVVPTLLPFGYNAREIVLVSWVGLKGAVPVILAIYPLLYGVPEGQTIFNVVFFVVLVSAVLQGGSLARVSRWLKLDEPPRPAVPVTLEITSLRDVDADIIEYTVGDRSKASHKRLSQLSLPDGVVVAMIVRDQELIPPRGSTTILPGDHVFLVLRPETRLLVDRVFRVQREGSDALPSHIEFPLLGTATLGDLRDFYGIRVEGPDGMTLDELIRARTKGAPAPGSTIVVEGLTLRVREVLDGRVGVVGVAIPAAAETPAAPESSTDQADDELPDVT